MVKGFLVILSVTVLSTVFAQDSVTVSNAPSEQVKADSTKLLQLTIEELAKYNGKDGAPAYVAVDSVIYDFSDMKAWKKGKHHGHKAGLDLTKDIKASPHGKMVLKKKKIVGPLVPSSK